MKNTFFRPPKRWVKFDEYGNQPMISRHFEESMMFIIIPMMLSSNDTSNITVRNYYSFLLKWNKEKWWFSHRNNKENKESIECQWIVTIDFFFFYSQFIFLPFFPFASPINFERKKTSGKHFDRGDKGKNSSNQRSSLRIGQQLDNWWQ